MNMDVEFKTIQIYQFSKILRACQIVARIDITAIMQSRYGNGLSVCKSIITPNKHPKERKYRVI